MIWFILVLLVFGFIFGLIARAVVPGDDSMSLFQTWALGVGGSLLGGFLGAVIFGFDSDDGALQAGGLIGSIIGSILLLLIVRVVRKQSR
ncbi:GlsB/YeaQ/YmgE family stress response membrane protein [Ilumatobacter sp.]|uniref:GlsB/YeaQ/YmgE family stress response membrane protein n=1 Tax=Ilumatobacter sp. TaxID=1967498 RepID=UPI003C57571F